MTATIDRPRLVGGRRTDTVLLLGAASVVYLPMVLGAVVGALVGGEVGESPRLDWPDLLRHNLLVGVLTAVSGLPTAGILTVGLAVSGSLLNGYQLAVVVQEKGWGSLLMGSPHFLPETAAFVCFTAIGLWPALRVFRHLIEWLPRESMARGAVRALVLAAAGTCLLLVAAWLESGTA